MSRLDHEESPAWGKGIDYFEIAKGIARDAYIAGFTAEEIDEAQAMSEARMAGDVLCHICRTWVNEASSDEILGQTVCRPCFQTIQGDLDANPETIE